jgi:hypothetical protein
MKVREKPIKDIIQNKWLFRVVERVEKGIRHGELQGTEKIG